MFCAFVSKVLSFYYFFFSLCFNTKKAPGAQMLTLYLQRLTGVELHLQLRYQSCDAAFIM